VLADDAPCAVEGGSVVAEPVEGESGAVDIVVVWGVGEFEHFGEPCMHLGGELGGEQHAGLFEPCRGSEGAYDFAAAWRDTHKRSTLQVGTQGLQEGVATRTLLNQHIVRPMLLDKTACGVEECGVFDAVAFGVEEVGVVAVVAPDGPCGVVGFVVGGLCGVDADEAQGEFWWEIVVAHIEKSAVEEVAFFGDGLLVVEGVEEGVADFVADCGEGFCWESGLPERFAQLSAERVVFGCECGQDDGLPAVASDEFACEVFGVQALLDDDDVAFALQA